MSVAITVGLGDGHRKLQNREIQHLEIVSRLGEPHGCTVQFDLDTNSTDALQDFQGALTVDLTDLDSGAAVPLFRGIMTGGTQQHQLDGGSRFTVLGESPLMAGMARRRSATRFPTTWNDAVGGLGLQTIGGPRSKVAAGGYRMLGETRLEFARRLADDAGYFLVERDGAVQMRSEFDDGKRCVLNWGLDLLAFSVRSALVNHHFRGGVYEEVQKADYRFHDQHREPASTGALKLASAVKDAAPSFGNSEDPDLWMSDSRATTRDVFRDVLLRESERTLGAAVTVTGTSRNFAIALGCTVQVADAAAATLGGSTGVFGVIELHHIWDSAEYRNEFIASPWKNYSNSERPPLRPVAGPILAEVLVTEPDVIARGFIHVRPAHLDRDGTSYYNARIVSPFTGNQRGFVFLPEPGDEVMIDFLQGDPEHAVLIGGLWNGKDACPGQEPKQVVTRNGNVLAMHDDGWIELYTPAGKCMLQMRATDQGTPRITLHAEGDLLLEATGQIQLSAASLVETISGGAKRDIKGDYSVSVGGGMEENVEGLLKVTAGTAATIDAGSKLSLSPTDARLNGATNAVVQGSVMAVVTAGVVQLNPPAVPPDVPPIAPPPKYPDELESSWAKRAVPEATPPFDTAQDSPWHG